MNEVAAMAHPGSPTGLVTRLPTVGHQPRTHLRLLLVGAGGVGLAGGTWAGLSRAGLIDGGAVSAHHGILMTLGFLGTLISVERAVALRAGWGYAAPALSALAVVWLVGGLPMTIAGILFTGAGLVLSAIYLRTWSTHRESHLALMGLGGLAWLVAALLWATGVATARLVPLLTAFLVLTIVGERLELSRLRRPSRAASHRLVGFVVVFAIGVATTAVVWRAGLLVMGFGLVSMTLWLARHDIARITIRQPGLPRFAAACMLSGYAWLAVGGLAWILVGLRVGGPLVHDAAIHAVFLGFVLSMVMGHAPIILPAVLRVRLPYRRVAWVPLALLHATVALRILADLTGSSWGRGVASVGNAAALAAFVAVTIGTVLHARTTSPPSPMFPPRPT